MTACARWVDGLCGVLLLLACGQATARAEDVLPSPLTMQQATNVRERVVEGRGFGRTVSALWSRVGDLPEGGWLYEFEEQALAGLDGSRRRLLWRYALGPDGSTRWAWFDGRSVLPGQVGLAEFSPDGVRLTTLLNGERTVREVPRKAGPASWVEAYRTLAAAQQGDAPRVNWFSLYEGAWASSQFFVVGGLSKLAGPEGLVDGRLTGAALGRGKLWVDEDCLVVGYERPPFTTHLVREARFDDLTFLAGSLPVASIDPGDVELAELQLELDFEGNEPPELASTQYQAVVSGAYHLWISLRVPPRGSEGDRAARQSLTAEARESYLRADGPYAVTDVRLEKAVKDARAAWGREQDIARDLADWARGAMNAEAGADAAPGWRPASEVLESGVASCEGYSTVLVAALRKAGIPARVVEGYIFGSDDRGMALRAHAWVEAWIDGWLAIEATLPSAVPDARYLALRFDRKGGSMGLLLLRRLPVVRVAGFRSASWPAPSTAGDPK